MLLLCFLSDLLNWYLIFVFLFGVLCLPFVLGVMLVAVLDAMLVLEHSKVAVFLTVFT